MSKGQPTKGRETKMANDFENKRIDKMVKVLNDLSDNDLMSLLRDANSYDGKYEFVDGWNMGEFLTMMMEGKKDSELVDFIMEVASAINDYNGSDGIENAAWGYPDIYGLEIRDWSDIAEQGREDYLDDLAVDVIEDGRTSKFGVLPSEVEWLLDEFDSEDRLGWEGAGTYLLYDDEDDPANYMTFDDDGFDSFVRWIDTNDADGAELVEN